MTTRIFSTCSLLRYQADGTAPDLNAANDALNAARRDTPADLHEFFRSSIRFSRGEYAWSWVLK
jgi:hypothetical protein